MDLQKTLYDMDSFEGRGGECAGGGNDKKFIRSKVEEKPDTIKQLRMAAFIGMCYHSDMWRWTVMYTKQPKKMLIMNILDILKKYTDENHRLSQKEIMDILEQEYDMKTERKAIKRNLMNLIDFGYDVEYSETVRVNKNGEEETIYTDWYLERKFSDAELRLLIDGLLFSKHIPYSQRKELIEKLAGLSSRYFKSRVKHIQTLSDNASENTQLFYTIEVLDKAITKGRQVLLHYNEYGTDKLMHPRRRSDGTVREYVINPYQMAAVNGRYYLICNYDKYDTVSNYRLDRITDIRMSDTPVKPMKLVKGLENGLNLPKHMAEHIYMFTGESVPVVFKAKKYLLTELFDWFGKDMQFLEETQKEVTVRVYVNLEAMRKWALQYAAHIKVISPEKLTDMVKEDIKKAMEQYEEEEE